MRLDGRTILVTGGAGGLGTAMAGTLRAAGGRVVLLDIDAPRGRRVVDAVNAAGDGPAAAFVEGDLGALAALTTRVRRLDEEVGGIDVLVNNGAVVPLRPIADYAIDEYEGIQRINAHAAFVLTQTLAPAMRRRGGGVVINVCSVTLGGDWANFVPYVTSKGALLGMTRALARELGPDNIRVNAISPGCIPTAAEKVHPDPESYARWVLERQALKFRGSPDDIAAATLFLSSDHARFITGQNLHIDGGWLMT